MEKNNLRKRKSVKAMLLINTTLGTQWSLPVLVHQLHLPGDRYHSIHAVYLNKCSPKRISEINEEGC